MERFPVAVVVVLEKVLDLRVLLLLHRRHRLRRLR